MEAAASVAGLVTLVGFALGNIKELHSFLADAKNSHSEVDHVITEIETLSDTLERVQSITRNNGEHVQTSVPKIEALIRICSADLDCWLDKLHRKKRKLSVNRCITIDSITSALNVKSLAQMRSRIAVHREEFVLLLASMTQEETHSLKTLSDRSFHKLQVIQHHQNQSMNESRSMASVTQTSLREIATSVQALECRIAQTMKEDCASNLPHLLAQKLQITEQDNRTAGRSAKTGDLNNDFDLTKSTGNVAQHDSESQTLLYNIVKICGFMHETEGRLNVKLTAVSDDKFVKARLQSKLTMIEYLRSLRLLIWILERQRNFPRIESHQPSRQHSMWMFNYAIFSKAWGSIQPDRFTRMRHGPTVRRKSLCKAWHNFAQTNVRV